MRSTGLAVAALVALSIPNTAAAQRVFADVRVQQGPVSGRVVIGDRYPAGRTVVVAHPRSHDRLPYRAVVVYRVHRDHGWHEHGGFRPVRIWYDAGYQRYYDRYDPYYPGLREVVVYERDGRYYQDDGWRNDDHRWSDRNRGYNDRD